MDAHELLLEPGAYMAPAKIVDGLTAEQAAARLAGTPHSVVELVAHLVFWQSWFLERCEGVGTPPAASASLGWPAASASEWESLRQRFVAGLERAAKLGSGAGASARRLDPPIEFPTLADYTVRDAITHVALHNSHHLGQIVTLRQIQGTWPPPDGSYTW